MTEPESNQSFAPKQLDVDIELRDGSITHDPRLDRVRQFDERSRQFSITPMLREEGATTPRSFTWGLDTTLDQGAEGACVGFSVSHELRAKPKVIANITNATALEMYHVAQHIDPWVGCYLGARCKVSPSSQRYDGTSVLAGIKAAQKAGHFAEYRWAFGVEDLKLAVSRQGPAILGIDWYSGMYTPRSFRAEVPRAWISRTGTIVGGHAILCVGYNIKINSFCLHNSWSPRWGINGRAWITAEDMDLLLRAKGEAVIPIVR